MKINIIAIGKIKEKYFSDAINEYVKRCSRFAEVKIIELPDAPFSVYCRGELFGLGEARDDGSLKIKTYLKDND